MNQQTMGVPQWVVGMITFCAYSFAAPQSTVAEAGTQEVSITQAGADGYVHDLSRSRFKIGHNTVVELDTPTFRRWRGSFGAWAIDLTNNWSMGILDADAPTGPYILDEAVQGDRVRRYFIEAGLPADQIRDVRTTYQVIGGGPMNEGPQSTPVQLHSITSILTRSVKGIPVAESLAWAKMTTSGDVDVECVFWPAIDVNVVGRAIAFAQRMADPSGRAAYLAKLPARVYKEGGVVIHHSDPSVHATPTSYVSYDVTLAPEGHAAMRHFDENGGELQLPQERAVPTQAPANAHSKPQPH
jgi:hypothetical protein